MAASAIHRCYGRGCRGGQWREERLGAATRYASEASQAFCSIVVITANLVVVGSRRRERPSS